MDVRTRSVAGRRAGRRQTGRRRSESGAVTAEAALALPVLVLVTLALVWMSSLVLTQVRLVDAARETARAVARDDGVDAARAQGVRVAPDGAEVEVREADGTVTVTVTARVHPLPGLAFLPAAEMSADAVTSAEGP